MHNGGVDFINSLLENVFMVKCYLSVILIIINNYYMYIISHIVLIIHTLNCMLNNFKENNKNIH